MNCKSNIDVINKYKEPRKVDVKVSEEYRKMTKRRGKEVTHEIVEQPYFYCRAGDTLEIITENPGEWKIVLVVRNKQGERFSILWKDITVLQ